jgi:hypothetical protein
MKVSIASPAFPRFYPDNVNCFTFIVAPSSYRILVEFEELMLEHEPQCAYDFVEMFEPSQSSTRQRRGASEKTNGFASVQQQQQLESQQLLGDYEGQQSLHRHIFQPSNNTYNSFIPPPSTLDERMPRRMCGDWSSKLKLLRYRSKNNLLGIRFSSDYSHHFSGFKAKISLEKGRLWSHPHSHQTHTPPSDEECERSFLFEHLLLPLLESHFNLIFSTT